MAEPKEIDVKLTSKELIDKIDEFKKAAKTHKRQRLYMTILFVLWALLTIYNVYDRNEYNKKLKVVKNEVVDSNSILNNEIQKASKKMDTLIFERRKFNESIEFLTKNK